MTSSISLRQTSNRNFSSSSTGYVGSSMLLGYGQSRMSRTSAASMFAGYEGGGAVGSVLPTSFDSSSITINEKVTMQNLNDRLASYLEKVSSDYQQSAAVTINIAVLYSCSIVLRELLRSSLKTASAQMMRPRRRPDTRAARMFTIHATRLIRHHLSKKSLKARWTHSARFCCENKKGFCR